MKSSHLKLFETKASLEKTYKKVSCSSAVLEYMECDDLLITCKTTNNVISWLLIESVLLVCLSTLVKQSALFTWKKCLMSTVEFVEFSS